MQSYYDARDGKTHCGRCDSKDWSTIGVCRACEQACCSECAGLDDDGLICTACAARLAAELAGEPMQGELFPELRGPGRAGSLIYDEEVA